MAFEMQVKNSLVNVDGLKTQLPYSTSTCVLSVTTASTVGTVNCCPVQGFCDITCDHGEGETCTKGESCCLGERKG